jgi:hypothetical protein
LAVPDEAFTEARIMQCSSDAAAGKRLSKCVADLSEADDCVAHKNFSIPRIGSIPLLSLSFRASHVRIQPSSQEARVGGLMLKVVVTAVVIF